MITAKSSLTDVAFAVCTAYVLSPSDSRRDRLASYLFWNHFSGLEQAIAVFEAQSRRVDLGLIEDWCRREGLAEKFDLFASRIHARARRR